VKLHVFAHAIATFLHRSVQRLDGGVDAAHVGGGASLRGQGGDFGLQGAPNFDHLDHGLLRCRLPCLELEWRKAGVGGDEHAAALARVHQAQRFEPRDRFAHHGAAHAKLFDQSGLGGKLVARGQAAAADLGGQLFGHLVRQAGATGDGGEGLAHALVIQKTRQA
jgi:hypothetical protein